ncbi:MAG: T9SS type A sorting domain-containing protein [bacterium]|nr:T9SS type A sorting domain-containing protein [bacterium]
MPRLKVWACITLFAVRAAYADTLYVAPGFDIADAIAAADSGDVILLEPGTFGGPVLPYGKDLTIASRYLLDGDTAWIRQTIVSAPDGDSSSTVIAAYGETALNLVGFTLQGGSGTYDERNEISGGGGMYVHAANVNVQACRFDGGRAPLGGGVFVSGSAWEWNAHVRIRDSEFNGCNADYWGGGIYADFCSLTVAKSLLVNLTCDMAAAGIHSGTSQIAMDSVVVAGCFGGEGGIGLYEGWGRIYACEFVGNGTPSTGFCNDISANNFWGEITRCVFRNTDGLWPSVHIGGRYGSTRFVGNVLENNSTSMATGTLIVNDPNNTEVSHNIFRNNTNVEGGAVYAFGRATARVEYNTFVGNSSLNPSKGAVLQSVTFGSPRFSQNIIAGNEGVAVTFFPDYPVVLDVRYNWWGHASGPYHEGLNPNGQGDTLFGDSVLFSPWLTTPPDTSMLFVVDPREVPIAGTWDLQRVFPNPFNNAFTVSVSGFADEKFELALHNILGQKVMTLHRGSATGGMFTFSVSPDIASGVYFLVAHDGQIRESIKVVLLK